MQMDPFGSFQDEFINGEMFFWTLSPDSHFNLNPPIPDPSPAVGIPIDPPSPAAQRSAFVEYARMDCGPTMECSSSGTSGGVGRNIHRRLIEALRRIPEAGEETKEVEMSRGFRHMMRERQRREKLSQSYADLYAMLSPRSKADKNSIVQSAAVYVRELKGVKDELQKQQQELRARIEGIANAKTEGTHIKFRVPNPASPIDSMIGALRCLKSMNVKARAIRSDISGRELSTIMNIETKVSAAEVERAVEGALMEVEKFRCPILEAPADGFNTVTWKICSDRPSRFSNPYLNLN